MMPPCNEYNETHEGRRDVERRGFDKMPTNKKAYHQFNRSCPAANKFNSLGLK